MTHRDESVHADAHRVVPSTRRSRRDGEREAQHRALYADSPQPASAMRVVDGGSPMYRTRREMRESASRLARDLPVIVEPVLEQQAAAAPGAEQPVAEDPSDAAATPAAEQSTADGRRARRASRTQQPVAEQSPAAAPAGAAEPTVSRRARRAAGPASAPEASATAESAPAAAEPSTPVVESAPAVVPAPAPGSRRSRRAASAPAATSAAAGEASLVAASLDEPIAATTTPAPVSAPTDAAATARSDERVVTRAERRAAQAASSDEVSAAVAAVLGSEQEDVASKPVRSPLRTEARPPRPAVVVRRSSVHAPVVRPSRRARSGAARKAMQRLAAAGVILSIGSFVAVTSLPAQAFSPSEPTSTTGAYGDVEVEQQLDVTTGSGAHGDEEVTAVLTRDDFGVDDALASARIDADELAALQAAADAEAIGPYYGGEPAMPGVWAQLETTYTQSPFPSLAEVPVSSGFGYRWGSFHGGVDLIPGAGTPVYPIANGVVVATWQGNNPGGGGYEVIVEHNIDGQYFQSWYPHMQAGSIQVEPGQIVDITTQLGAVGSTGRSTGAHLHLEIKNGDYISVDPLVWLATREQILEP